MSHVAVYALATLDTPNKVLTHADDIASTLADHGVRFERWQPGPLERGASEAQMIAACQPQIDALGYSAVEVFSVGSDQPHPQALRARHLKARCYSEDHARLFIAGQGLYTLQVGDYLYAVRCEKNDLLVIPAGLSHGFDIGENPCCVTLCLSNSVQGLTPEFTVGAVTEGLPGLDD
ncbi:MULTISPECIES: acireductone dioxygenase [Pseudomonas]|uniref:1,2-dihydroxy-3-keto-5-methylthiopentene dioxygenase n=1 Tax=Pseudomonas TaxID=286 RepID=UPI001AE501C5|nr:MULTISPECIES: acireductone dioxygenase [unclassified Pseudomonas]MBP1125340.1 1,2-dihydroxy-3-keto-5-methylthiopentene dioxygenase [Pseudomonas sp. PvP025]MDQ0399200.1 1,2-dihydroxy-3-keto-5-methylthiopentene dioxygenase [Pseudomonas sp. PvP006]